jgi:hypothetical protein
MTKRYILHIEWHKGYKPRFSIRRVPRHGDKVFDGGEKGTLIACQTCSTTGFLFKSDSEPKMVFPLEQQIQGG